MANRYPQLKLEEKLEQKVISPRLYNWIKWQVSLDDNDPRKTIKLPHNLERESPEDRQSEPHWADARDFKSKGNGETFYKKATNAGGKEWVNPLREDRPVTQLLVEARDRAIEAGEPHEELDKKIRQGRVQWKAGIVDTDYFMKDPGQEEATP